MRPTSTVYPNGRTSFWNYSRTVEDKLSRLAYIEDDNGSGAEGSTLSSYKYNGVGRMVDEEFVQPSVRLNFYDQTVGHTVGTYEGLDRFGRTKRQLWRDSGANADRDAYLCVYDYNSNRTYRENTVGDANDEKYTYDDLNRLLTFERGTLVGSHPSYSSITRARGEQWILSDTGNWTTYKIDADGDGYDDDDGDLSHERDHNLANELEDDADAGTDVKRHGLGRSGLVGTREHDDGSQTDELGQLVYLHLRRVERKRGQEKGSGAFRSHSFRSPDRCCFQNQGKRLLTPFLLTPFLPHGNKPET